MADKQAIMRALQEAMGSSAPMKSKRPMARPNMIGASPSGGTRGIDPKDNYSKEDLMRLLMSAGARSAKKPAGMMGGGKVMGYKAGGAVRKKKPKMGCVMSGRGGKYKGQS